MFGRLFGGFRRRQEPDVDSDPFFAPLDRYFGLEPPLPPLATSAPALAARILEAVEATDPGAGQLEALLATTPIVAWHEDPERDLVAILFEQPTEAGIGFTTRLEGSLEGSYDLRVGVDGTYLLEVRTVHGPESIEFLLACRRHLGMELR